MRDALWNSMLDADLNARYWGHLSRRYYKLDKYSKVFLAITTSVTIASWSIWNDFPLIWKILSSISTLLAISLPLLDFPRFISDIGALKLYWTEIRIDYELLWMALERGESENILDDEYKQIKYKEIKANKDETNLPHDNELLLECRYEVLKSRGLI